MSKEHLQATPTLTFQSGSDVNIFWLIIRIVLYLLFIGGLMLLVAWVVKRKKGGSLGPELIQVIAMRTIAPGKYIQIVEFIDRILILGVGENINILDVIKDKETIDLIKTEISRDVGKKNPDFPFASYLFKKKIDFIENERDRLRGIEK